jgi:A/G-specific adenine glycosylase
MSIPHIRRRLLRWYDNHKRDLPWRRTSDPYKIWVAETMLQQTQVKTVLPYYERFMDTLPTLAALDRAPLRKVLALWSGLGYYRRAENLKRAARRLARAYDGKIPPSYDVLRSLPGIGEYTAGAVMSIAFRRPFPAVDANARRVLTRLFGTNSESSLRSLAERVLSPSRPGDFNQALMDLGSTICTPHIPSCAHCPLVSACAARLSAGLAPVLKTATRSVRNMSWPLALIRSDGKVLLRRRTANGILAGLWEVPGGERIKRESFQNALRRHLRELDYHVKLPTPFGRFRHSITNRNITVPLFLISLAAPAELRLPNRHWRWFTPTAIDRHPVSAMTRKALRLLQDNENRLS